MSPYTTWLVIYLGIMIVLSIKFGYCQCGKRKLIVWLFTVHPPTLYMAFNLFMCICTIIVYIGLHLDWSIIAVWVYWSLNECYRIWYHEKDKIKKALKALGSIRFNEHGKLVVTNHG